MKVCLVSSGWIPIVPGKGVTHGGGIETQVYGLAKALTKLCDEVHLITVAANSHSSEDSEGITYHTIRLPSRDPTSESMLKLAYCDLMFALKSKRLHERLKIDLVHCNTKFPALAAILSHSRRPLIFTAHNWKRWEGVKPEWKSGFARMAYDFDVRLERYIAQRADRILAVSHAMKKGIVQSTGVTSKKVAAAPNAVDSRVFYPEKTSRSQSILYVGRITAEKGVHILLQALPLVLEKVPRAKLVIVGPSKFGLERGDYEKHLRQLVKELGVEPSVTFTGTVSVNELRKMYSQASVFCLPSVWQEPFGLTLIEAMACETPVVGTRVGGIPEIVSKNRGGLLVKPEAGELANAITEILLKPSLGRRLGKRGRKTVTEEYTFDRLARSVYSVYSNLLK